jgi:hypothetical protein
MAKQMVMECIPGLMGTGIRENLKIVLSMEKECKNLQMVIHIKATMLWENHKDLVNTFGQLEAILRVIFKMGLETVKEFGNDRQEIVINIKDNIKMIKNKDMAFLHGKMAILIKATTLTI